MEIYFVLCKNNKEIKMEKISEESQNRSETISESHVTVSTEVLDSNPQKERILKAYKLLVERYKLPEDFLQDEVNQSLLLGACQKLIESTNPIYKKRIKSFIQVLVAPAMTSQRFDPSSLWGRALSKGDRSDEEVETFINSIKDALATEQFKEKHRDLIERSKEAWKKRGYNLDLEVTVVDDKDRNFAKVTGAKAYINPPELKDIQNREDIKFPFVVVKGRGAEEEGTIRHELYHVEDYFDFIRRGLEGTVLESLDELHTEYMSGNYNSFDYDNVKKFWNKLSYSGDLDFDLLSDRKKTIKEIVSRFGFEGLMSFCLMAPYNMKSRKKDEIFINEPERIIVEMLVAKEKLNLRKDIQEQKSINEIILRFKELVSLIHADDISPENKTIYDFIKSKSMYDTDKSKELLICYTKLMAFAELYYTKEITGMENEYQNVISLLREIPHKRRIVDFNLESHINSKIESEKQFNQNLKEIEKNIYQNLFFELCNELTDIQYINFIENSEVRDIILEPFLNELDILTQHCLQTKNEEVIKWFLDGFKMFSLPTDVLEIAISHLKEKYPELADKL